MFFSFFVMVAFSIACSKSEMTSDTISEFNIGQMLAFTNIKAGICVSNNQFAIAKKVGSGQCQWEISGDYARRVIDDKADLPIADFNRNCYFACVPAHGSKKWHTEKIINRRLKDYAHDRSQFDMYSYLAPCRACVDGAATQGGGIEKADLDKYRGVYYSYNLAGDPTVGTDLRNDDLLNRNGKNGLDSIKCTTKVDLQEVKRLISEGRKAFKLNPEIISEIQELYLRNAVASYLKQHPWCS